MQKPCVHAAAIALTTLVGCGSEAMQPVDDGRAVYIGTVHDPGADAVVALVATEGLANFYVCGGDTTVLTHTGWMAGDAYGSGLQLEGEDWSASGAVEDHEASGWLARPDGPPLAWTAQRAAADTIAGLYATVDSGCRTGVVVTQQGPDAEPTVRGSWCDEAGARMQVTPILPVELTPMGLAVQVMLPEGGTRRLDVQPVTLTR
jgi:hypothetical protein